MRLATRVARRAASKPTIVSGGGPATETVVVNSVTAFGDTVTGASNDNTGAATVLGDGSDATHVGSTFYANATVSFAALQDAGGRQVDSFEIVVRCACDSDFTGVYVQDFTGVTPTPSSENLPHPSPGGGVQAVTLGPFAGPFSAAAFDSLTCLVALDAETATLNRISAVVTYAT